MQGVRKEENQERNPEKHFILGMLWTRQSLQGGLRTLSQMFDVYNSRFPMSSWQNELKMNLRILCGHKLGPGFKIILNTLHVHWNPVGQAKFMSDSSIEGI